VPNYPQDSLFSGQLARESLGKSDSNGCSRRIQKLGERNKGSQVPTKDQSSQEHRCRQTTAAVDFSVDMLVQLDYEG